MINQLILLKKKDVYAVTVLVIGIFSNAQGMQQDTNKYAHIFTKEIYDQSEVLASNGPLFEQGRITEEEFNNKLEALLYDNKKRQLEKKSLTSLTEKLSKLALETKAASTKEVIPQLLKTLTGALSFFVSPETAAHNIALLGSVKIIGELIAIFSAKKSSSDFPADLLIKEMRDLKNKIEGLREGLKCEPIGDLEKEYIRKKRLIAKNFQDKIENKLIETRTATYWAQPIFDYIHRALNYPSSPLLLGSGTDSFDLAQKIMEQPFFEAFSHEVKEGIESILNKMVRDSRTSDDSQAPLRGCYYFWGNPGCGKTTLAINLAQQLGLSYFEKTIKLKEELSVRSLEGVASARQDEDMGWLIQPLLAHPTSESIRTYRNAFLILNDFDRALFDSATNRFRTESLKFLLDTLETHKKSFKSNYFDTDIDISRLNIIITANMAIPRDTEDGRALASRFTKIIHFPDLPPLKITSLLNTYMGSLIGTHAIPKEYILRCDYSLEPMGGESLACPYILLVNYNEDEINKLLIAPAIKGQFKYTPTVVNFEIEDPADLSNIRTLQHSLGNIVNDIDRQWQRESRALVSQADEELKNKMHPNTSAYESILALYMEASLMRSGEASYKLAQLYNDDTLGIYNFSLSKIWMDRAVVEQEYAPAQNALGEAYAYGRDGVEKDEKKAVELYTMAANQGLAIAQNNLGIMHEDGRGVQKDEKKAVELYTMAANQGLAMAQNNLGIMHEAGRGVQKDEKKAVELYTMAANQGLAMAQNKLGMMHEAGLGGVQKDEKKAVKWYTKAANQGLAMAQNKLGMMYEAGRGVEKNPEEAAKWYTEAANQDIAMAQNKLGMMYEAGRGVEKNPEEAAKWYTEAANQGLAMAQNNLGMMYEVGRGVEKNPEEAAKWYTEAANQGLAMAQNNLGMMYEDGRGVGKDVKKAIELYTKAANQGLAMAQNKLGVMYGNGRGVQKNEKEAVKWYTKAANQGLAMAQNNLGMMYEDGRGVQKDVKKAVDLYTKAAKQGLAIAHANLGIMYKDGRGVKKDEKRAFDLMAYAADQKDAFAQYVVGCFYGHGIGTARNEKAAFDYYLLSAEEGNPDAQYKVGYYYETGISVSKDLNKAREWYRKSADQDHREASERLKKLMAVGPSTPRQFLGLKSRFSELKSRLKFRFDMVRLIFDISRDLNKATEWYRKSAASEHLRTLMAVRLSTPRQFLDSAPESSNLGSRFSNSEPDLADVSSQFPESESKSSKLKSGFNTMRLIFAVSFGIIKDKESLKN